MSERKTTPTTAEERATWRRNNEAVVAAGRLDPIVLRLLDDLRDSHELAHEAAYQLRHAALAGIEHGEDEEEMSEVTDISDRIDALTGKPSTL